MLRKILSCLFIACHLCLSPLQGFARGLQGPEEETAAELFEQAGLPQETAGSLGTFTGPL